MILSASTIQRTVTGSHCTRPKLTWQDARVNPPQLMALQITFVGSHVLEKCSRFMLMGRTLVTLFLLTTTLPFATINDQSWASLADAVSGHAGCPGTALPPPPDRYDKCWGEVFEIWKK